MVRSCTYIYIYIHIVSTAALGEGELLYRGLHNGMFVNNFKGFRAHFLKYLMHRKNLQQPVSIATLIHSTHGLFCFNRLKLRQMFFFSRQTGRQLPNRPLPPPANGQFGGHYGRF